MGEIHPEAPRLEIRRPGAFRVISDPVDVERLIAIMLSGDVVLKLIPSHDPGDVYRTYTRCRLVVAMAGTRTFSFRAEADLGKRHDRALAELERLRRERPRLADSVRYDFDVRLADAQERGLSSPAERLRATVTALVSAVEQALADEPLMDGEPSSPDDDALAAARATADAAARRYEDEESGAR